ncbi:MAG: hypothetical protein KDB14_21890 [Planctomycetales bacterium]|nr:hypothetical protein [Planctomycetales bacterium]
MSRKRLSKLHVFAGSFPSRDAACLHTERQWEPEPDESASDEEYAAWEDRNPTWAFRDELGTRLESEFIETIDGHRRYQYLGGYLNTEDVDSVRELAGDANILVLVFPDAIEDPKVKLKSTSELLYCGSFDFVWP